MRHEAICEVCGKQFVHYYTHSVYCCSKKCRKIRGYKSGMILRFLTCDFCGETFEHHLSTPRRFCSKACRLKAGWRSRDPAKRSIFICDWCGKKFETWTYRQPRFCSAQCRSEYGARQPKPNARRPENFITCTCEWCGKPYEIYKSFIENPGRNTRFCSNDCRYAEKSESMRGENNPLWNGGHIDDYGPNWGRQRRRAVRRDNHACQMCGYKSGGNRYLDVHHIIPAKSFNGDWEAANDLANLVCLCRPCHGKAESSIRAASEEAHATKVHP